MWSYTVQQKVLKSNNLFDGKFWEFYIQISNYVYSSLYMNMTSYK